MSDESSCGPPAIRGRPKRARRCGVFLARIALALLWAGSACPTDADGFLDARGAARPPSIWASSASPHPGEAARHARASPAVRQGLVRRAVTTRTVNETSKALAEAVEAAKSRTSSTPAVAGDKVGELARILQAKTLGLYGFTGWKDVLAFAVDPLIGVLAVTKTYTSTFRIMLPLLIVVGVFVCLGFLMLIVSIVFGLCRCCNRCGGRNPKKSGYTTKQIVIVSALTVATAIIAWVFAALVLVHSKQLGQLLPRLDSWRASLFSDVDLLLENAHAVVSSAAITIDSGVIGIYSSLRAYKIADQASSGLNLPFQAVFDALTAVAAAIQALGTAATQAEGLMTTIKGNATSARTEASSISASISSLQTISFTLNSQTYSANMNIGSTASPNANDIPDPNSLPNITVLASKISSAPDMGKVANDAKQTYTGYIANLSTTYLSTLDKYHATVGSPVGEMTDNLKSMIDSFRESLPSLAEDLHTIVMDDATRFDGYRHDATTALMILLVVPYGLAFFGVFVQKRKCLAFLPPICVVIVFLTCLQFVAYYIGAIPLNGYCVSNETVLGVSYTIYNAPGNVVTLQPLMVIQNCKDGESLLNMTISPDGSMLADAVGLRALLGGDSDQYVGNFENTLLLDAAPVSLPTGKDELDKLASLDLANAANLTAFSTINPPTVNVTTATAELDRVSSAVTSEMFSSTQTLQNLNTAITNFFAIVNANRAPMTAWDYDYIRDNYVVNQRTFSAADVGVTSNTNAVENDWNSNVLPRAQFRYQAVDRTQAQIKVVRDRLTNLEKNNLTPMISQIDQVRALAGTMQQNITNLSGLALSISSATTAFTTAVNTTLDGVRASVIKIITDGVEVVFSAAVGQFVAVGKCATLGYDIELAREIVCERTSLSVNVLWFSFSVICVACVIGFIVGVKGSKRIGCRKRVVPTDEERDAIKKNKALDEF